MTGSCDTSRRAASPAPVAVARTCWQRAGMVAAGVLAIAYGSCGSFTTLLAAVGGHSFVACVEMPTNAPVKRRALGEHDTYFVELARSPVRAKLLLPAKDVAGGDVWLLHAAAANHCRVRLASGSTVLGEIDNRRPEITQRPEWFFTKLCSVPDDVGELQFELFREDGAPFYAEIGGLVVSPKGWDRGSVLQALSASPWESLCSLATILLGAALIVGACRRRWRRAVAIGSVGILTASFALLAAWQILATRHCHALAADPRLAKLAKQAECLPSSAPVADWLAARCRLTSVPKFPFRTFAEAPREKRLSCDVFVGDNGAEFSPPSHALLGGALRAVQNKSWEKFARRLGYAALAAVLLGALACRRPRPWLVGGCLALIAGISVALSLRLSQGWDELYMNLRHSFMLCQFNVFSANSGEMIEGTVDSLPFFAIGLLGKFGPRLDDLALCGGLLGNALVIAATFDIVRRGTRSVGCSLVAAAAAGAFPSVIYVGATGFTATLFAGTILCAFDLLYVRDLQRRWQAYLPLVVLPLIRTEGIVLCFLVFCHLCLWPAIVGLRRDGEWRAALRKCLAGGLLLSGPFLASCLMRYFAFGMFVPIPIVFKAAASDAAYMKRGVLQFLEVSASFRVEQLLLIVLFAWLLDRRPKVERDGLGRRSAAFLGLLTLFTLPYYLGGGDWFLLHFARYAMPLLTAILAVAFVFLQRAMHDWLGRAWPVGCTATIALLTSAWLGSATPNSYRAAADDLQVVGNRWQRVDQFATFGDFLKTHTSPAATVASPEVATVMYFAERDMLDLLGVSNREIAECPLYPLSSGNLVHRKRNPAVIRRHLPEIICLHDMSHRTGEETPRDAASIGDFVRQRAFNQRMLNIAYYRVGAFEELRALGYRHVAVSVPGLVFNFFVLQSEYETLCASLQTAGYDHLGTDTIPYRVSERLLRDFPMR